MEHVFSHLGCHVWGQHLLGGVGFAWIMEGFSSTVERETERQKIQTESAELKESGI